MIKTEEYMSSPVVSLDSTATVKEAAQLMDTKNIGSLLVLTDGEIAGIMTERDIIRKIVAKGKNTAEVPVSEIMTEEVVTIQKDASLMEVAALMKDHRMRRLIVLFEDKAVGIITSRDLIGLLV